MYSLYHSCIHSIKFAMAVKYVVNPLFLHLFSTGNNIKLNHYTSLGCPCDVMVKNAGQRNRSGFELLRSLSDKYPWERYEPPYPPSYGLNSPTTVILERWY